jgi:uncharacterized protein (DUF1330 family)
MAADRGRYVALMGLEVTDDASYARYRAGMTPILEAYGGSFGCDFVVAKVLKGPSERLNRVFTITFPDRATQARFFADARYREVRAAHFEGAVAEAVVLAELVEEGGPQ